MFRDLQKNSTNRIQTGCHYSESLATEWLGALLHCVLSSHAHRAVHLPKTTPQRLEFLELARGVFNTVRRDGALAATLGCEVWCLEKHNAKTTLTEALRRGQATLAMTWLDIRLIGAR